MICRRVEPYVGSNSEKDIKDELKRLQPWCEIKEIIKFRNLTHIFKIVFEETNMAKKAINNGLLLFNMKIAPDQIEQETYVHIKMCYNCYAIEDHAIFNCPNKNKKICSECSKEDHTRRECTSEIKKMHKLQRKPQDTSNGLSKKKRSSSKQD